MIKPRKGFFGRKQKQAYNPYLENNSSSGSEEDWGSDDGDVRGGRAQGLDRRTTVDRSDGIATSNSTTNHPRPNPAMLREQMTQTFEGGWKGSQAPVGVFPPGTESMQHPPLDRAYGGPAAVASNAPPPPPMAGFEAFGDQRPQHTRTLKQAAPPPQDTGFDSELARAVKARSSKTANMDPYGSSHSAGASGGDAFDLSELLAPASRNYGNGESVYDQVPVDDVDAFDFDADALRPPGSLGRQNSTTGQQLQAVAGAVMAASSELTFSEQVEEQIRQHNAEVKAAKLVQAAWRRSRSRKAGVEWRPRPSVRKRPPTDWQDEFNFGAGDLLAPGQMVLSQPKPVEDMQAEYEQKMFEYEEQQRLDEELSAIVFIQQTWRAHRFRRAVQRKIAAKRQSVYHEEERLAALRDYADQGDAELHQAAQQNADRREAELHSAAHETEQMYAAQQQHEGAYQNDFDAEQASAADGDAGDFGDNEADWPASPPVPGGAPGFDWPGAPADPADVEEMQSIEDMQRSFMETQADPELEGLYGNLGPEEDQYYYDEDAEGNDYNFEDAGERAGEALGSTGRQLSLAEQLEADIESHEAEVHAAVQIQRAYRSFKQPSLKTRGGHPVPVASPRVARRGAPAQRAAAQPAREYGSQAWELDGGAALEENMMAHFAQPGKEEAGGYIFNDAASHEPEDDMDAGVVYGAEGYDGGENGDNNAAGGQCQHVGKDGASDENGAFYCNDSDVENGGRASGNTPIAGDTYDAPAPRSPTPRSPSAQAQRRAPSPANAPAIPNTRGAAAAPPISRSLRGQQQGAPAELHGATDGDSGAAAAAEPEREIDDETNLAYIRFQHQVQQERQVAVEPGDLVRIVDKPARGWFRVRVLDNTGGPLSNVLRVGFVPSRVCDRVDNLAAYHARCSRVVQKRQQKAELIANKPPKQQEAYRAKFSCSPDNPGQLTFSKGDRFFVRRKKMAWLEVDVLDAKDQVTGRGWVPSRALMKTGEVVTM